VPRLVVDGAEGAAVLAGGPAVAGRLASCALQLNESQSSRKQFVVEPQGSRWRVRDLESRNGTFLNDRRLGANPVPLRHGDRIRVGDTVVRYESDAAELAPGTRLGGVEVGEALGRSEYGTLYGGRQGSLERDVVVEVVDPDLAGDAELRDHYQRRAREAGAFEHPGVLAVFDTAVEGDRLYTVYEACPGLSLEERLAGRPLPPGEALELGAQVAEALAHVHGRGKVHGCLGPAAVLLDARGRVKLRGLGEGDRARLRPHRADARTQALYASPEEAAGGPATPASDVYALGAIVHHLLTGRAPYDGKPAEVLASHAAPEPVPTGELPPGAGPGLAALLAKPPGDRPGAKEAAERLRAAVSGPSPALESSSRGRRAGSARRRGAGAGSARLSASSSARARRGPSARGRPAAEPAPEPPPASPDPAPPAPRPPSARRPGSSARARARGSSARRGAVSERAGLTEDEGLLPLRLVLLLVGYGLTFLAAALAVRVVLRLVA